MNIGRLARTVGRLHPMQIASRVPHALVARVAPGIGGGHAPLLVRDWPEPTPSLRALANAERVRGAARLAHLTHDTRLHDYEACYGLELGADEETPVRDWGTSVAIEPFPASIRARRIAVATRCGRRGLATELARAARAVLLQPEVHLLGNHLIENGFALVCAGAVATGLEADLWWHTGARILEWQLPRQFLADGGHIERSASYHLALTAGLLEAMALTNASGRRVHALWQHTARQALGWIEAARTPDGEYPLFNDSSLDAAPGSQLVADLGADLAISRSEITLPHISTDVRIAPLTETGWARIDVGDACLIVDVGPDAEGWQPGHAHADGLTFELWLHGQRAIVDFGVASYAPGPDRDATRATRSHNTVELDGHDSCEVWGAFRVGRRGRGRLLASTVTNGRAELRLEHDGYSWLAGAPVHQRTLRLTSRSLEVEDTMTAGARATSRLRVDDEARLAIVGPAESSPALWYPRHGHARAARLFAQTFQAGQQSGARWRIEW